MFNTNRNIAEGIEPLIGVTYPILDHGHIIVLDYMGNDAAIVQAARTSYQAGTKKINEDKGLINYLMRMSHHSPFEMCELKIHVRMPIFVARQFVRHRTAALNEMSARYSILPDLYYVPEHKHCAVQSKTNKQGRGQILDFDEANAVRNEIIDTSKEAYNLYEKLLGETKEGEPVEGGYGLARELARMVLPTNFYTEWVWKCDLRNLFHFLGLRADSHAQYEIRVYAEKLCEIVKAWCPMAYDAWEQHHHESVTFSKNEKKMLSHLVSGEGAPVWQYIKEIYNLTDKQVDEFKKKLMPKDIYES